MRLIVLLTAVAGLLATALATNLLYRNNQQQAQAALAKETARIANTVAERVELYQYGLRGVRGAVLASGEWGINRQRFLDYSKTRDPEKEFPGASGFGFIRRVAPEAQAGFLRQARADGMPEFDVQQLSPHDGERFVIQYIEPLWRNRAVLGLDIASEETRRSAAVSAMSSGEARISGPISLKQVSGKPLRSFLILLPIYRGAMTPDTPAGRWAEGFGWSYAPLLTEELLHGLHLEEDSLYLRLNDVSTPDKPLAIYASQLPHKGLATRMSHSVVLDIYGRRWQIELNAQPLFLAQLHQTSPRLVALAGGLGSVLMASLAGVLVVSRRRKHQVLAEQARSAAIVEGSNDAIIGQTLDGRVISWNRGAEKIFGYTAEEALGQFLHELIVPAERVEEECYALQMVAAGEPVNNFDTLRRCKGGRLVDVSTSVSPMLDGNGMVIGVSRTVRDISVQKKTEARILELNSSLEEQVGMRTKELHELNLLLNTVMQSASEVSIIATDTAGLIRIFNRGAERLLGYTAAEMVGVQTPALIHLPEEQQARSAELSAEYGQPIEGFRVFVHKPELEGAETREWTFVRKDGSRFSVTLVVTAMRDEQGTLVGYLGIGLDLSQQLQLRREALAMRDQLLLAAEVAELGIWSWTPADNRLQWNERMFELYDQPLSLREDGLEFEHWRCRLHPEDVPMVEQRLRDALKGHVAFDPVFRILRQDGQVLHIQAGAQVEWDAEGNPLKVTGINRDITAQLQLEAHLRHAKAQADAASAAKSAFLANMSHEIRTPMNAVLGMLQLVQATGLNARQLDYVQKAHGAGQSLLRLLNDILDYSKIEAGKLQLDPHDFELEPLMRDLAVVLAGNQGSKDIEIMFDLDTALPNRLHGDSLRLQQVLINLSGNALKFTGAGQVVVSLRQLARTPGHVKLRVAVSDTGIGISEEQLQRIFDGFTQAEASTTRRYGGSGLGLVICKRLIELMGSTLHVESRPGEGSRFWFDLELGVAGEANLGADSAAPLVGLRLLIVDDNAVARQLLQQMVLDLGWQADVVSSGREALASVQDGEAHYDVVLMDWRMPDMDGVEAAQRLREQGSAKTPLVIMITAYGREVLADRYGEGGAPFEGFLTKPVTPQQLIASIRQARHGEECGTPSPGYRPERRLQGLHLLVVEDNPLNRQVARELLMGEGAEVSLAEDGRQGVALALSCQPPFDAVLMDIQMPDMDGLEATRRIRLQMAGELPIIAMTANASLADRDVCLAAGMNDHVGKPIDIENLVAVLLQWVGRAGETGPKDHAATYTEGAASILKRFGGNLMLLRTVLATFPAEMNKQLASLEAHYRGRDIPAILAGLHTLKGSSGTMGVQGLADRAAELEQRFKLEPDDALTDPGWWLDELRQLLERGCIELQGMFAEAAENPAAANRQD